MSLQFIFSDFFFFLSHKKQANFEFNNARRLVKDPKTALRLFTSAEQKYLEVLSSNPNDIQTNLNLAETLRSKLLVKDCHRFEVFFFLFCFVLGVLGFLLLLLLLKRRGIFFLVE